MTYLTQSLQSLYSSSRSQCSFSFPCLQSQVCHRRLGGQFQLAGWLQEMSLFRLTGGGIRSFLWILAPCWRKNSSIWPVFQAPHCLWLISLTMQAKRSRLRFKILYLGRVSLAGLVVLFCGKHLAFVTQSEQSTDSYFLDTWCLS